MSMPPCHDIEPETSTRNTRLHGGMFPLSSFRAWSATRASLCAGFHGHGAASHETASGLPSAGCG